MSELTPAYLWFDTEFTSLEIEKASLLQVAMIITDSQLNRLTKPDADLNLYVSMEDGVEVSEWVEENLSGLLAKCRSSEAVSVAEADRRLAEAVDGALGGVSEDLGLRPVLAGNTVYMDLLMARKCLPEFSKRLHYRLMDVSAAKLMWKDWGGEGEFDKESVELVRRYLPDDGESLEGEAHDAYFDVHASLAELRYYREHMKFQPSAI